MFTSIEVCNTEWVKRMDIQGDAQRDAELDRQTIEQFDMQG